MAHVEIWQRGLIAALVTTVVAAVSLIPNGSVAEASPRSQSCARPTPGVISCFSVFRGSGRTPPSTGITPRASAADSGYSPTDLSAAYQLPVSSTTATIAIVDAYHSPSAEANLKVYRSHFGLPSCTTANGCFEKVNQSGAPTPLPTTTDGGWAGETDLDLQMVSAVCPTCHLLLVETDDNKSMFNGVAAATSLGAKFISMSWGMDEGSDEQSDTNQYFDAKGVAYVAASGDSGFGVSYPAASQNVLSVGGTALTSSSDSRGWDETVWNNDNGWATSSGCSQYSPKPAWQTVVPNSVCAKRAVADVSVVGDPETGVAVYSTLKNGTTGWLVVGGTSAGAPIVAAMFALAGTPATDSYPSSYPYWHRSAFNDVTDGDNTTSGDAPCTVPLLCTAAVGWDAPSGLGTPKGVVAFTAPIPGSITLRNPGTVHSFVATPARVDMLGSSDSLAAPEYSAAGLPVGMTMTPSGTITGTPMIAGTSSVVVTAAVSGEDPVTAAFTWIVARHSIVANGKPTITGVAKRRSTVKLGTLTWHSDQPAGVTVHPALTYRWYLNGKPIANATKSAFTIPNSTAYQGRSLQLKITATLTSYNSYSITTAKTKTIA